MASTAKNKIDIWSPIANVLLMIFVVFIAINVVNTRELKKQQSDALKKEVLLTVRISNNNLKIDSLQAEVEKRDLIIEEATTYSFILDSFVKKYEKELINIDTMSVDGNIIFFSTEVGD